MRTAENKHEILVALVLTLKRTRAYRNLIDMYLEQNSSGDYVVCKFTDCAIVSIDVSADSGIAMIRDILKGLEDMA